MVINQQRESAIIFWHHPVGSLLLNQNGLEQTFRRNCRVIQREIAIGRKVQVLGHHHIGCRRFRLHCATFLTEKARSAWDASGIRHQSKTRIVGTFLNMAKITALGSPSAIYLMICRKICELSRFSDHNGDGCLCHELGERQCFH